MEERAFRKEERVGLGVALVLHLVLFAAFLLQPSRSEVLDIPERMTVSLAEDVGLEATAPEPVPESRAAIAPTLAEQPVPVPDQPRAVSEPLPPVAARPQPSSQAPRRRPDARPSPAPRQTQASGGSRIGDNFLGGAGSSTTTEETRIPASQIGASAKASIVQAIARQIKPHWNAPSGADAELLVTILAFDLDEDGRLKGRPRVVSQSGDTASNAPQKALHAERAIRAVQLAAPFDLPDEYYNAWKSIRGARFDRNLSR